MSWHRLTVAGALIVIGCAAPGPSLVQTVPAGSGSPIVVSASASPSRPPTAEPTSITGLPSPREQSDAFWIARTDFGRTSFEYENLREITEDSHLIILGRVTGIEIGSIQPFDPALEVGRRPVVFGVVTIDEVLKGRPQMFAPNMIRVARIGWEGAESQLPTEQVILFLKNYAQMREEAGAPPAQDDEDALKYSRPNEYQAVLRVFDGVIEIVDGPRAWKDALWPFPGAVDGEAVEDVTARIRRYVDRGE
jgi:hypothetical protein